jgi:starvation-inducible DNA-binding protein
MKKPTANHRMHETRISLPIDLRRQLVDILNQSLATYSDLQASLKQAHWNVKGSNFYALHLLFDEIAEEVEGFVDEVAERISALGGTAFGTVQSASEHTLLKPYDLALTNATEHLIALAERLSIAGKDAREKVDITAALQDQGSSDLYVGITRALDKRLWFIEAHLQTTERG